MPGFAVMRKQLPQDHPPGPRNPANSTALGNCARTLRVLHPGGLSSRARPKHQSSPPSPSLERLLGASRRRADLRAPSPARDRPEAPPDEKPPSYCDTRPTCNEPFARSRPPRQTETPRGLPWHLGIPPPLSQSVSAEGGLGRGGPASAPSAVSERQGALGRAGPSWGGTTVLRDGLPKPPLSPQPGGDVTSACHDV